MNSVIQHPVAKQSFDVHHAGLTVSWCRAAPVAAMITLMTSYSSAEVRQQPAVPVVATTPSQELTLTFDWPDGMKAWVIHEKSTTRNPKGQPETRSATSQYELKTRRDGALTVVSHANHRVLSVQPPQAWSAAQRQTLENSVRVSHFSFLVDGEGAIRSIADLPELQQRFRDLAKQLLGPFARAEPVPAMVQHASSEAFIRRALLADWNPMVGFWAGLPLKVGQSYDFEVSDESPASPQGKVRKRTQLRILHTTPCTRSGTQRQCVELELTQTPHPRDAAVATAELMRSLTGRPETAQAEPREDLQMETTVRLLTEPAGLVPHRLERQVTVWQASADGRATATTRFAERHSLRFVFD